MRKHFRVTGRWLRKPKLPALARSFLKPVCSPRVVTVNSGGRNEQGYKRPDSATSRVWDLRQTLTSVGLSMSVSAPWQSFISFSIFFFKQNPSWKATIWSWWTQKMSVYVQGQVKVERPYVSFLSIPPNPSRPKALTQNLVQTGSLFWVSLILPMTSSLYHRVIKNKRLQRNFIGLKPIYFLKLGINI